MVDPCFIHCHIFMQKTPFCCIETVANNALNCRHSVVLDWLRANVASTSNTTFSCKMVNTLPSDIFNSFAISCNFNLRSAKTYLWSFLVFSGTTAKFGWPEHSALFASVWLHIKSAYHLLTVVSIGAESD